MSHNSVMLCTLDSYDDAMFEAACRGSVEICELGCVEAASRLVTYAVYLLSHTRACHVRPSHARAVHVIQRNTSKLQVLILIKRKRKQSGHPSQYPPSNPRRPDDNSVKVLQGSCPFPTLGPCRCHPTGPQSNAKGVLRRPLRSRDVVPKDVSCERQ